MRAPNTGLKWPTGTASSAPSASASSFTTLRVTECSKRLEREFKAGAQSTDVWQQVKLHYIGLLVNHHQPELAETFFNSVTTKILHRSYFHNDFIFVRPAVSTEYIEDEAPGQRPTYRSYYPTRETLQQSLVHMVGDYGLRPPFEDLERDAARVTEVMRAQLGDTTLRANFQVQLLTGLFFRNKGCYIVGKLINGFYEYGFALPILHNAAGKLVIDAALFGQDDLLMLFSFARAYFMVDMDVPSRLCAVFAQHDAPKTAQRNLQRAGAGQAGKDLVLP